MKQITILAYLLLGLFQASMAQIAPAQTEQDRPNIVWVVTEDNSIHYLDLYRKGGAAMPTIEKLADQGIVFNHAFSQAAVCSAARSTIISGCYGPRTGSHYHRRTQLAPMPDGLEMFPSYLRKAGYYATNNSKEDYNFIKADDVWDESSRKASYRNRKEGQPFFHVQNFTITHESSLHFDEKFMKEHPIDLPEDQTVPFPYHPDTPLLRYTNARYRQLHQEADAAIGKFLMQLEEDGLMDDTFIFYYGDHGGVLPRSKGYIYETGLHVPMVVYVPEKWKHLVPVEKGGRTDAFVQFIDLGPTVLNLAGVEVPEQMDGKPFLGAGVSKEDLEKRNTTFSYADRFDEKYDLVRGYRKGKYKYMRSYQPFNMDGLQNNYRYRMLAYQEWRNKYNEGSLNATQRQFFLPRSPEALYDVENDPYELNNLADDPAYADVLKELRGDLAAQVKSMPDLSFFPEPYFLEKGINNPVKFGQNNKAKIAGYVDIADLMLLPFKQASAGIEKALASDDPWERYWGLVVCSAFGEQARPFFKKAMALVKSDPENLVAVRAIEFLGLCGKAKPETHLMNALKKAETPTEANLILNTVALLETALPGFDMWVPEDTFDKKWLEGNNAYVARRLEFINIK